MSQIHRLLPQKTEMILGRIPDIFNKVNQYFLFDKIDVFFILFLFLNLFIGKFKPYLFLVVLYVLLMFFLTKNIKKTLWLSFFSIFLLFKTKFFSTLYDSTILSELGMKTNVTFFISFSDSIFLFLLYFIFTRRKLLNREININLQDIFILILLFVGVISSLTSFMPSVSWFYLFQFTKSIILYYLSFLFLRKKYLTKKTISFFVLFVFFNSILIILQKINGSPLGLVIEDYLVSAGRYADEIPSLYRPGGVYWDPNFAASLISMALPIVFFQVVTAPIVFSKFFNNIIMYAFILSLVFTSSRATWIVSFSVIIYLLIVIKRSDFLNNFIKLSKQKIIILFFGLLLLSPLVVTRMFSLKETLTSSSGGLVYRLNHIKISKDIIFDYPVGIGLNTFQYFSIEKYGLTKYFSNSSPAHNIFAQVSSGFGVLGLIAIVGCIIMFIKDFFNVVKSKNKDITIMVGGALFVFILVSQFYPWFYSPLLSGIFWLFLGIFNQWKVENENI